MDLIICEKIQMELLLSDEVIHDTLPGSQLAVVHLQFLHALHHFLKLHLGASVPLLQALPISACTAGIADA